MKTLFVRLIEVQDKGRAMREALQTWRADGQAEGIYEADAGSFGKVPGSPFAYWVAEEVRDLFEELPPLASEGREVRQGLATAYDFRFIRLWWEVDSSRLGQDRKWVPFAKGGKYSPYYSDIHLVVNWNVNGRELYRYNGIPLGGAGAPMRNVPFYFQPGLTWPLRSQRGLSLRALPKGCVFGHKGPSIFIPGPPRHRLGFLALGNSQSFQGLVEVQMAFGSFEVGVLSRTAVPPLGDEGWVRGLATLASRGWSLARTIDQGDHVSHAFILPLIANERSVGLQHAAERRDESRVATIEEIRKVQRNVESAVIEAYGEPSLQTLSPEESRTFSDGGANSDQGDEAEQGVDPRSLVASLLEWTVGVTCGRFDIRLATGERPIPEDPDPFDPLPVCSPGMLQDESGFPATTSPAGYPIEVAWDGILVDDKGHPRDIVRHIRRVLAEVSDGQDWASEAEEILGRDLRGWVQRSLFEDHIKRHSKSRRKAPIFWRLGTPSGSYSVWLYYPRATEDTLFRVLNDYVEPKLRHEESELLRLRKDAGPSPTASQQKHIEAQETLVSEVQDMKAELEVLAQLWSPEFDDGVVLNFAPFWRLVAHTRSWQKECQKHWKKLVDGEYDWSYTAMRLWPERVVPACAEDRSFAIAHGLEEEFFPEDAGEGTDKAPVVRESTRMQELVAERHSPAVKQALGTLLDR